MILPTLLLLFVSLSAAAATLDLKQAVVVSSAETRAAATLLVEEIPRRTTIRPPVSEVVSGRPVIELAAGKLSPGDDGFRIEQTGTRLRITGNTPRGTLRRRLPAASPRDGSRPARAQRRDARHHHS
jgi:hypothetical protein